MLRFQTVGDLSRSFLLQNQTAFLKRSLERLSYEVTTGRAADITKVTGGDYLPLNSIEARLDRLEHRNVALAEFQTFVETGQRALETIGIRALDTGASLITASGSAEATVVEAVTDDARQGMKAVVSAFNSQIGGQAIFAGKATNRPALADAGVMINDIVLSVGGASTAQDVVDAVTAWFDDPGGGFETLGYTGSANYLEPLDLGLGRAAGFEFAASDREARDVLKGFALAAVLSEASLGLPPAERQHLLRLAGEHLLTSEKQLAQYRAAVGVTEAAVAAAAARNAAELSALEIARADIVRVDQYAAAGDLEAAQVQLEMLYAITARMSRLNLMEFLR